VHILPVLLGISTPTPLHVASPTVRLCPFVHSPANRGRNIYLPHSPIPLVHREFTICFYCLPLLNTGLKPLVLSECIVPNWFLVLVRKNVSNQGYLEVQCFINRQEFFLTPKEYTLYTKQLGGFVGTMEESGEKCTFVFALIVKEPLVNPSMVGTQQSFRQW
jgi:hypothetical protein